MKSILVLSLFLFSLSTIAANDIVRSINKKGLYQAEAITPIKDKSNKEIYDKILDWIKNDKNTKESIIQFQVLNKKLTVRSIKEVSFPGIKKSFKGMSYILDVEINDEVVKFKMSNFRFIKENSSNTSIDLESKLLNKDGSYKKGKKYKELKNSIDEELNYFFLNLQNSLEIKILDARV